MNLIVNTTHSPYCFAMVDSDSGYNQVVIESSATTVKHMNEAIAHLCGQASLSLADCQSIVFVTGPGSYTGTRMGAALVEALLTCHALPVYNVNLFDLLCVRNKPKKPISWAIQGFGQYFYGATCHWQESLPKTSDLSLVKKELLDQFGTLQELSSVEEQASLVVELLPLLHKHDAACDNAAKPCYVTTQDFWR